MAAVAVTSAPLDLQALIDEVGGASTADGAVASFIGLVREQNQGRRVSFLEYEAYEPLAVRALQLITEEARASWADTRIAVHHRIGRRPRREVPPRGAKPLHFLAALETRHEMVLKRFPLRTLQLVVHVRNEQFLIAHRF